jgi:hypothetical protein
MYISSARLEEYISSVLDGHARRLNLGKRHQCDKRINAQGSSCVDA